MTADTHPASSGFDYSTRTHHTERHPNNVERMLAGRIDSDRFIVGWGAHGSEVCVSTRRGVRDSVMSAVREAVRACDVDAEIETDGINKVRVTVNA